MKCFHCECRTGCKKPKYYEYDRIRFICCSICYASNYGVKYIKEKEQLYSLPYKDRKYKIIKNPVYIKCWVCSVYLDTVDISDLCKISLHDIYCKNCYEEGI